MFLLPGFSHADSELLYFMCNAKIQPQPIETLTVCSIREVCITLNNFWLLIINQSHLIFNAGLTGNSISTLCQVATAAQCEVMSQGGKCKRGWSCASWGHWKRACKKGGQKLPPELFSFAKNSLQTFIWKRKTLTLVEIHWNNGGNSALAAGLTLLPHLALRVSLLQTNNPNSLVTRGHSPGLFLNKHQNTCTCQTL